MIIRKMRCYFLYNVPVTERMMSADKEHTIGVSPELIDKLTENFIISEAPVPAFYTSHYRDEHTPFYVIDPQLSTQTRLDAQILGEIDFFSKLNLTKDPKVSWDFVLSMQTTGLITICVEVSEELDSKQSYRLSGLHLNPSFQVIDTEPIKGLWRHDPQNRPPYITLDDLACAIHEHFFRNSGINVRRFRALRHEIQIPFTAVEVDTDCETQDEFVEKNASELAELVFKPANWEVEHASRSHARRILAEDRVWSVAQDTYVVTAYEGALYVKIKTFDTGVPSENSGFYLADESSVLHSFKVAVSNYHLLRILDDLLDVEIMRLKRQVANYQGLLRASFDGTALMSNNDALRDMNDFVIQVTNLEFDLMELMEELDNSDKLIDEEWHIVLLDKLNDALGIKVWRDGMNARVDNLRELVQTVENTYQRLLNLAVNRSLLEMNIEDQKSAERDKRVGYLFGVFAISELLGLMIEVGLNDNNALATFISSQLNISIAASHWISILGVLILIVLLLYAIRRFVNRGVEKGEKRGQRPTTNSGQ